mmetsp:Transcript_7008/g.22758  ORF Transcript_7008/g.22758 Transcript_7008/m.22758 type:complete len:390 (-) Transcript_7008:30-1199(-)
MEASMEAKLRALKDSAGEGPGGPLPLQSLLLARAKEFKQQAYKFFVHYGPPYKEEYGGNLPEECNDPNASRMDIHGLLNDGGDPRVGNKLDFGNTPLHYAARYCNMGLAKMLLQAGARPAQLNELGMNALGTAAMFNPPAPRCAKHLKLCKWLVDHGADVNNVDKGGHTALEIAAGWGNLPLCSLLLECGARVHRELTMLSIMSPSAVDVAATDDVRALVKTREAQEVTAATAKKEANRLRLEAIAEAARALRRQRAVLASIERRKGERVARRLAQVQAKSIIIKVDVKGKIEEEQNRRRALLEAADASHGVWKKDGAMSWHFQKGLSAGEATESNLLAEASAVLEDTQGAEHRGMLQRRWRAMTGLELTSAHPIMQETAKNLVSRDES